MSPVKPISFRYPSLREVEDGSWTPLYPKYHPFIYIDDFCISCFKWRLLKLLKGSFPKWKFLIYTPNLQNPTNYENYHKDKATYYDLTINILRSLARSNFPNNIYNNIANPSQLLQNIVQNNQPTESEEYVINQVSRYLQRLDSQNQLKHIIKSKNILFNVKILIENFDLFLNNQSQIQLRPSITSTTPNNPINQLPTYQWTGKIAFDGVIPLIDLEKKEIRSFVYIAQNFFNPIISWANVPFPIKILFLTDEMHKLWLYREILAQLVDIKLISPIIRLSNGNNLFNPNSNLEKIDFRKFSIILDTIDSSFNEAYFSTPNNTVDFRNKTGQAAIIQNILYSVSPSSTKFYNNPHCIFKSTPNASQNQYFCPLQGNVGCGLSDRRTYPRDRSEINIFKFLRLLRDESVFEHRKYYLITRFYPNRPYDLNVIKNKFWIGQFFQENNQHIFKVTMPSFWSMPDISDKEYEIVLISPLCYESGFSIKFSSNVNGEFILQICVGDTTSQSWSQEFPFSISTRQNPLNCIIGDFSLRQENFNIQNEKRNLLKVIQYENDPNQPQTVDQKLQNRLDNNTKRIGESIFGQYARLA